MKSRHVFLLLCLCRIGWAHADIYKSIDAEGHTIYSNTPSKGAKLVATSPRAPQVPPSHTQQSLSSKSTHSPNITSPVDFPKVDSSTQKSRDGTRRKILSDELSTEEKLLAEARVNLKQGEAARNGGITDGRLHALQEEVTLHEKNVGALKTELSNTR